MIKRMVEHVAANKDKIRRTSRHQITQYGILKSPVRDARHVVWMTGNNKQDGERSEVNNWLQIHTVD